VPRPEAMTPLCLGIVVRRALRPGISHKVGCPAAATAGQHAREAEVTPSSTAPAR